MKQFNKFFIGLSLIYWGFFTPIASGEPQPTVTYSFMVVPQYSPAQLHKEWLPLIERISRETGVALQLKISASIPEFESSFMKGAADFAYLNPYHAVMARQAQGYLPLVRDSKPLNGILLVRSDSPIHDVRELNGSVIGFPSPNAFGASLYMRALLTEKLKIKFEPRYLNTHSNVFRHVVQGSITAGGGVNATLNDANPDLRERLRVLYQTPNVASHPIVAHPRVPASVRVAITEAFLALQNDDVGRNLLKEIRTSQPTRADYERDYQSLESLGIQKYVVLEKN